MNGAVIRLLMDLGASEAVYDKDRGQGGLSKRQVKRYLTFSVDMFDFRFYGTLVVMIVCMWDIQMCKGIYRFLFDLPNGKDRIWMQLVVIFWDGDKLMGK